MAKARETKLLNSKKTIKVKKTPIDYLESDSNSDSE